MGVENPESEILSTWKEIAAYLKTSVRTCLRWEAGDGLPVHRQDGAPKSRVYAYKNELDSWFKARLTNGTLSPQGKKRGPFDNKWLLILLPLSFIAGGIAFFLLFGINRQIGKSEPISEVPTSSGPFENIEGDIVTTEWAPAGRLRVWREKKEGSFFESWRIEPVRHTSLAIGNLDGDDRQEIVAPGHCREFEEVDGQNTSKIRFFLNVYKYGFKDWWKTTFYDFSNCVFEKDNFEFTDSAIGDVDGRPGNEIVMIAAQSLSVFRYDPTDDVVKLLLVRNSFIEGTQLLLRALALEDIDGDDAEEILVLANEGEEDNCVPNKGWLIVCRLIERGIEIVQTVPLEGSTSIHSLGVGDVIPGGSREVVFPCYRLDNDLRSASLVIWEKDRGIVYEKPVRESRDIIFRPVHLGVGNLFDGEGDEILIGTPNPNEIVCYGWSGDQLVAGPKMVLDHRVGLSKIVIDDSRRSVDGQSYILVCGDVELPDTTGRFYLELFAFMDSFIPRWSRMGGDTGDLRVTYAGFVKSPEN